MWLNVVLQCWFKTKALVCHSEVEQMKEFVVYFLHTNTPLYIHAVDVIYSGAPPILCLIFVDILLNITSNYSRKITVLVASRFNDVYIIK